MLLTVKDSTTSGLIIAFILERFWADELFNGKGLKAKHMPFVGLFHSIAGKTLFITLVSYLLLKWTVKRFELRFQ